MMPRFGVSVGLWLGCVLAANWATGHYGLVGIPWLGLIPAGTLFAGAVLVLRDVVQDEASWWVIPALIAAGSALSFGVAPAAVAVASCAAFAVSEMADWAIYTPLRRRGWVFAAMTSSVIGGAIDSALFLRLAFDSPDGWVALAVAKTVIVTGTVWAVGWWRQ